MRFSIFKSLSKARSKVRVRNNVALALIQNPNRESGDD
jgi:hypothetical protein